MQSPLHVSPTKSPLSICVRWITTIPNTRHWQSSAWPPKAVAVATEVSIRNASSSVQIALPNGDKVRVACAGDLVEYADGSSAAILSESGEEHGQVAVVGSRIANGDEIIDTPQQATHLVKREGKPFSVDYFCLKRA